MTVLQDTDMTCVERHLPHQQILQKKGCGCIIHISDFVKEENGHLIICNKEGDIIKDAQTIIYPGVGSDPWWDHTQLLVQIDKAISIFKEAHLECVALFVFDMSSAHASLRPDALCVFNINKSNGGKQRKQKDMVIPMNNAHPEFAGKSQKMMTGTSEVKGLKQVLEEHRFNTMGMLAKCAPVCSFENTITIVA